MTATVSFNLTSLQSNNFFAEGDGSKEGWRIWKVSGSQELFHPRNHPLLLPPAPPLLLQSQGKEKRSCNSMGSCAGVFLFFYLTLKAVFIFSPTARLGDCLL